MFNSSVTISIVSLDINHEKAYNCQKNNIDALIRVFIYGHVLAQKMYATGIPVCIGTGNNNSPRAPWAYSPGAYSIHDKHQPIPGASLYTLWEVSLATLPRVPPLPPNTIVLPKKDLAPPPPITNTVYHNYKAHNRQYMRNSNILSHSTLR